MIKIIATKANLPMIKGLIDKIGKGKILDTILYYPSTKKIDCIEKSLGINNINFIYSSRSVFEQSVSEVDFMFGSSFIRIHNCRDSNAKSNVYLAFLIKCGDLIEIKNNVCYVKCNHPTRDREKATRIIQFKNM